MRRQAARRAAKVPAGERMIVYHGTTAALARAIRRAGLRPRDGLGPWVTSDEQRAAGYAVRAVCLALVEAGHADQPHRAAHAALLTVTADRRRLVADQADDSDYVVTGGAPPAWLTVTAFDARPWLPDAAGIREYAALALEARAWEPARRSSLHGQDRAA